ncbi:MAG: hypothetical protein AAGC60_27750 [Acidobacteriota bacterium]
MKTPGNYLLILLLAMTLALTLTVFAAEDTPEPVQTEVGGEFDLTLVNPPEVEFAGSCLTCVGSFDTGQFWEMGSDCASAADATEAAARAAANADCRSDGSFMPACNFTFFVDQCYDKDGGKVVDGHANYGCWEGDYFCPE